MAKQQETFTRVPNIILDDPTLDVYEVRLLLHIARQTIGYGKKSDGISLSQFQKATGMGVSKVKMVINDLKDKKLIKVIHQTKKDGGKSYNRYSLTLVRDKDKASLSQSQGLVRDKDIQNKIEQNKIDKNRETETISSIFFSLTDHERKREANSFAEYESRDKNSPAAYKVKLLKQINKEHPETLEAFQEWYFTKTCAELNTKYRGKQIDDYEIESIYPYTRTTGYTKSEDYELNRIYYVQARNTSDETERWGADSFKEMDRLLEELTMEWME